MWSLFFVLVCGDGKTEEPNNSIVEACINAKLHTSNVN